MIEFTLWHHYDYEAVNLGGSASQAKKVYNYLCDYILRDPLILQNLERSIQSHTSKWVSVNGHGWERRVIHCLAASQKQIRSPHIGSSHHGGILLIDEEAEADPALIKGAISIVDTANPRVIVRMSTFHYVFGSFQELWDGADEKGYKRYEWDSFDICEPCFDRCEDCISVFREEYCRGRAHEAQGWKPIENLRESWRELDRETFEIEELGSRPSRAGLVYDTVLVDQSVGKFPRDPGQPTILGIDWGLINQCAVLYCHAIEGHLYVYREWVFSDIGITEIRKRLADERGPLVIDQAWVDSSHPFEIKEIKQEIKYVRPVVFNKEKDIGVSTLKWLMEKSMLHIDAKCTTLIWQLKNLRRNKDTGKIEKRNDHGPDALLCVGIKVMPVRRRKFRARSSGG
jgi:hypothetical protein